VREKALALLGVVCLGVLSKNHEQQAANSTGDKSKETGATPPKPTQPAPRYVKMPTREETILVTMKSFGYPTLEGKWYWIGYFENADNKGFDTVYPPEKEIDFNKIYPGKIVQGQPQQLKWKDFADFQLGRNVNLYLPRGDLVAGLYAQGGTLYLYHEFEVSEPIELPIVLGAHFTVKLWFNQELVTSQNFAFLQKTSIEPDQRLRANLKCKRGKNQLLIKVGNFLGEPLVYICPQWPPKLEAAHGEQLKKDFPR
jgi:hypothetical protein